MGSAAPNEVDEVMKGLKQNPGFTGFIIMNNDGIVVKYENMEYKKAVQHAALVLDLCAKSKKYMRELMELPDNEVESLRLRTTDHEMIIAQREHYTIIVIQQPPHFRLVKEEVVAVEGTEGEKKEAP